MRALTKFAAIGAVAALACATGVFLSRHPHPRAQLRITAAETRGRLEHFLGTHAVRRAGRPVYEHHVAARASRVGHLLRVVERTRHLARREAVAVSHFWVGNSSPQKRVAPSQKHLAPTIQFVWQIESAPPVPARKPYAVADNLRRPHPEAPSPKDITRIAAHLKDSLDRALYARFQLFVYVSKAAHGPWAQHMYVFDRQSSGDLRLLYDWPVSTGLERDEINYAGQHLSTHTPAGLYELDPHRFYVHHVSDQWHEPMPYAMFLNWVQKGYPTGLAIHGVEGSGIAKLGTRASSGCVRLSLQSARTLFSLIRSHYRGPVPRFAISTRTHTMSNDGALLLNRHGGVELAEGYKVLVFIEDYGGENFVAAVF